MESPLKRLLRNQMREIESRRDRLEGYTEDRRENFPSRPQFSADEQESVELFISRIDRALRDLRDVVEQEPA